MVSAILTLLVVVSMVAIGILVWHKVNGQERGDDALEDRLRRDDERAEDGRRRKQGLPPIDRSQTAREQPRKSDGSAP